MKSTIRSAELLYLLLLVLGLAGPLVFFFARVAPWQTNLCAFFTATSVQKAFLHSIVLSVTTSLLSTTLAFAFSWLLWRFHWSRAISQTLAILLKTPYLLPPFFFAIGWIALAAPTVGYFNRLGAVLGLPQPPALYGLGGTIFVETLWTTALAMISLRPFFSQYPGHLEDAAILCGASPLRALMRITIPLARPYLLSCLLLSGISALSAFGVPAMLASPARVYVLTTKIYQGVKSSSDFNEAALLSLALLAITSIALTAQRLVSRRSAFALVGGKASRPAPLKPHLVAKLALASAIVFALLASVLPCLAVLFASLLRDPSDLTSFSADKWIYVFTRTPETSIALRNSLFVSLSASLTATLLGTIIVYASTRRSFRSSTVLIETWNIGYAMPGTVIALSLMTFYAGSITDTLAILALAYVAKYAGLASRILSPPMSAIGRELEEAAWMSGASPRKAFARIFIPMLKPAIAATWFLAFVPMLSELTMSVLLVGTGTQTLGSVIYNLQEYADPGSAAVLAVTVMGAVLALNAGLKRLSKGTFGI